jgi:hypothetical protein
MNTMGLEDEEKITLAFLTIDQRKNRLHDKHRRVKNVRVRVLRIKLGAVYIKRGKDTP